MKKLIKKVKNFIERIIHRDTWLRLSIVTETNNHSIKSVQKKYNPIIDELYEKTGRNKEIIRNYLLEMAIIGVKDEKIQIELFKTIHITSQNIERTIKIFSRAIATGILSDRQFGSIGIIIEDKEDFKLRDINQRAELLSQLIELMR